VAAVLAATAGCSSAGSAAQAESIPPAASAGGACQLLDFGVLERRLGAHYTVAASAAKDSTLTCVVRTAGSAYPEITLSVAPSIADANVFRKTVQPKGATKVDGLGRAAYRQILPANDAAGQVLEVGWLGTARLLWLRMTLPAQAGIEEFSLKLVVLAKDIDALKPIPAPTPSVKPSASRTPGKS
jgi:hypothetical protein